MTPRPLPGVEQAIARLQIALDLNGGGIRHDGCYPCQRMCPYFRRGQDLRAKLHDLESRLAQTRAAGPGEERKC